MPPYDSSGNRCGVGATLEYGVLYFEDVNPLKWVDKTACVKACPTTNTAKIECFTNKQIANCHELTVRESYTFAKRFCWPKNSKMEETTKEKFAQLGQQEAYGDIIDSWKVFLLCAAIAFVISLVYLFILEKCAGVVITLVIVLFMAGLTFLAYFFHKKHKELKTDSDPHNDDSKLYLYLTFAVIGIEVILLLCFCCLWSRITLAARIIEATADYITDVKRIVLVPLVMMLALIIYLVWWSYSGALIFSTGETRWNPKYPWGNVTWSSLTK